MLMAVKNQIKVTLLSIKYNLMKEMTNSVTFITNIIFMIFNNATFIVQWLVLFTLKDNFGGYVLKDVLLLWALSSSSYGIAYVLFNGIFKMPKLIEDGKMDSFLILPKNTLLMVATSSTRVSALGDLLYGYILLLLVDISFYSILMFTIFIIIGGVLLASLACIFNSLTFWFTRSSYLTDSIIHIFINCSTYPESIFNKGIKIILYTLIPVAAAIYIPMEIILKFNLIKFLIIVGVMVIFILLAFIIFYNGLKRYTSSNLMLARN